MSNHNLTRINALLQPAGVVSVGKVHWFERIDSTNNWLLQQQHCHGKVCVAELQTAGRGSHGRSWQAWPASSVLLSIGWRLGAAAAAGLSLVSGLAVVASLRRVGVDAVALKWPNDLLVSELGSGAGLELGLGAKHGGKKLGGVLTELKGAHAVVGIGINVRLPPACRLAPTWVDLKTLGYEVDRDLLAAALIICHCHYLRRFCAGGFAQFVDEWNQLNAYQGQRVSVELPGESVDGIVQGVDHQGALLIQQHGGRRRIFSGQVRRLGSQKTP